MMDNPVAVIASDPLWHAHRYDPEYDAFHFRRVTRADHRRATFLTDENLPPAPQPAILRRAEAVQAARARTAPLHVVFHSAFCCSTLMARALDREGWAMGLKEPVVLNDLVGWRRRGADIGTLRGVLADALTLMSRPFAAGEAVVIKPSNLANGFAMEILGQRAGTNALLMYAPLQDFLISIAKKGLDGRIFAREIFLSLLKDGLVRSGFSQDDLFRQTDLQIAALGWLAQQDLFRAMVLRFGPDRVRTLSSADLLADPRSSVTGVARLFGLADDAATLDAVVAGPGFTTHSKSGEAFGAAERRAEYADAQGPHIEEIEKVLVWLQAVADNAGIPLDPGGALNG